ncbi:MAG: TAT-variant-translocated molybdopterin oxidoreductase [Oscillochloris sp.]|nr:TAT-variant-translocated molybdopterin oxidoreductase [Oscillochloris sp.]
MSERRQGRIWRSLEELAGDPGLIEQLAREFPQGAAELRDPLSRRSFLKLMGASLALAGLSACAQPNEEILPYSAQPDPRQTPGEPLYFATTMPLGGYGIGLLAENHTGRPTKIEGNPDHPASLGATDVFAQASVLGLYDPDRARSVTLRGQVAPWETFVAELRGRMEVLRPLGGAGLHILTETITSPSLAAQLQSLLEQLPQARWYQYEPLTHDTIRAGAQLAFGRPLNVIYDLAQASRILTLDADLLQEMPGSLAYARQWAAGRRLIEGETSEMNRLYAIESAPTLTGANADHKLALRPSQVTAAAGVLANLLGVAGVTGNVPPEAQAWLAAAAADLQEAGAAGLVVAGAAQPPEVHALAYAMNAALGSLGSAMLLTEPVEAAPVDQTASLRDLTQAISAGEVDTLMILEANPAFTAPADLRFAELLAQVPFSVQLSMHFDETAALTRWHIPESHYLERWGDLRAYDGTASLIQPLIQPLFENRSAYDLLALLAGEGERTTYEIVRGYWQNRPAGEFDAQWDAALRLGIIPETAAATVEASIVGDLSQQIAPPPPVPEGLEVRFRPDATVWDGRFANNAWLQELPDPITTVTWDNPALIGPETALQVGVTSGDVALLSLDERSVPVVIWVTPGMAEGTVALALGGGRERAGTVGDGVGINPYPLRTSNAMWLSAGAQLTPTGETYPLAHVQSQHTLEDREILRFGTLEEYRAEPAFARHTYDEHLPGEQQLTDETADIPSLLPEYAYLGYAWGMAIDLNACIGCHACTIACQAENNIPVVGKDGVAEGRIMHWIKVDRYYSGDADNPETLFQPRPCMHCEKAPCELVCPVAATVHDSEGLNQMVYNRCIGTRYCSNNCPYKVRRFNFFDYSSDIPVLNLVHNPDVTVRERGVMEKCTYCVQRIERARIESKTTNRRILDGEVVPACAQVCPTEAIIFGDISDPDTDVSILKAQPRNYGMLAHLGTQPRTTYLARIRNPNPAIG